MFNLFKKEKSKQPLKEQISSSSNFLDGLSEQQKAAMIYLLMLMVSSEGSHDMQKFIYLTQQADLLKVDLEGKSMEIYEKENADYAYSIMKTLYKNQKDFYSVMLSGIMHVNGNPTKNETLLAGRILEESEISEEQFKNANLKAKALQNRFNS